MDEDISRRFEQLEYDVKENTSTVNEIQTILMGPSPGRTNGVRGDLLKLSKKFDEAMEWAHNIWNVKRREECLGLAEVTSLRKEINDIKKEQGEMAVAKTNLKGVYLMSFLQFIAAIAVAYIMKGSN